MAQTVKNQSATWESWIQSLSQKEPLEKRMATHSSILAWKISWTEEPGELQYIGLQRVGQRDSPTWRDSAFQGFDFLYFTELKFS